MPAFNELIGDTNAQKWAHEFVKVAELRPDIPTDEGTMIGWFANAIMSGYDEGREHERKRGITEIIHEIAFQAAGAGSGAVMQRAPDVVMPSSEITARVNAILIEHGIPTDRRSDDSGDFSGTSDSIEQCDESSETPFRPQVGRRAALRREVEQNRLLREHESLEP